MTIQEVSRTADAFSAASDTDETSSSSSTSSSATSVNENQFLQLLVAQLKNQDPMNPADGTQFISELAQFSMLQETIGVHQDFDALLEASGITPAS